MQMQLLLLIWVLLAVQPNISAASKLLTVSAVNLLWLGAGQCCTIVFTLVAPAVIIVSACLICCKHAGSFGRCAASWPENPTVTIAKPQGGLTGASKLHEEPHRSLHGLPELECQRQLSDVWKASWRLWS